MSQQDARNTLGTDGNRELTPIETPNLRRENSSTEERKSESAPQSESLHKSLIPCQFTCALRVNIPEMLQAAGEADWQAAWEIFAAASPLPFSTAYLCRGECRKVCHPYKDHPTVDMCHIEQTAAKGILGSNVAEPSGAPTRQPISEDIPPVSPRFSGNRLEQFDLNTLEAQPEARLSECAVMGEPGAKAAVIGDAPAALAAAYHLAVSGYDVTLFSAEWSLGGWLQDAAAGMRLPRAALQRDMARLRSVGIRFDALPEYETDHRNLREKGYDVVLVAPQMVNAERRAALVRDCFRGLVDSNAFVRTTNRHAVPLPGKIIVLGTGFDSVDAARVAVARGCEEVTLLVHVASYGSPIGSAEIRVMREEGIEVKHCDFLQIRIERKQDGFQVVFQNTETRVEGKMILLDGSIMPYSSDEGLSITLGPARPATMAIDVQTMLTDTPGVFAIDPARLANNSITEELAQGERAARIAREFVEGRVPETALTPVWIAAKSSTFPNPIKGGDMPSTINEALPRSAAQEATRCRKCNRSILIDNEKCIGCLRCLETCFTGALYATDESGRPLAHPWRRKPVIKVDSTLCERCGACVSPCPTGAISINTLILRQNQSQLPVTTKHTEEESATWERYGEYMPKTKG